MNSNTIIFIFFIIYLRCALPIRHLTSCSIKDKGKYYCGSNGKTYRSVCHVREDMRHDPELKILYAKPCKKYLELHPQGMQETLSKGKIVGKFFKKGKELVDNTVKWVSEGFLKEAAKDAYYRVKDIFG